MIEGVVAVYWCSAQWRDDALLLSFPLTLVLTCFLEFRFSFSALLRGNKVDSS